MYRSAHRFPWAFPTSLQMMTLRLQLSRARFFVFFFRALVSFFFSRGSGFTFLHFVCQEDVSFWERFVCGGG